MRKTPIIDQIHLSPLVDQNPVSSKAYFQQNLMQDLAQVPKRSTGAQADLALCKIVWMRHPDEVQDQPVLQSVLHCNLLQLNRFM
jgi:hypothetical protein